jgi:hypothetical protein
LKIFPNLPVPSGEVSKPTSLSRSSLKGSGCIKDLASKEVWLFSSILRSLRLKLAVLMGGLPG